MATAGPRYPGTAASLANAGTSENSDAWVNPTNVGSDNATEATIVAASYDSPDIGQILVASNFGFAADIPAGSTIQGITVEIDRRSIIANSGKDFRVQLATGTTFATLVGNNKAVPATIWPTTSTVATYGGAADMWGTTLTRDQIAATGFAVFLSAQANIANADIGVDYIRVTVNYTAPAPEEHSGTLVTTGGGAVPRATRKDGLRAIAETGGGTVTSAAQKGGLRSNATTGGGVVSWSRTADHRPTIQYTGGGTVPLARSGAHSGAHVETGGGTTPQARTTARVQVSVLTGGGTVPQPTRQKGGLVAQLLTGGGSVAAATRKGALRAQPLTGGGTVVIAYEVDFGSPDRSGILVVTGAGTTPLAHTSDRLRSTSLTGGGTVASTATSAHNGGLVVAGGGAVLTPAEAQRLAALVLSGGGQVAFIGTREQAAIVWPRGHYTSRDRFPVPPQNPQGRRRAFRRWW